MNPAARGLTCAPAGATVAPAVADDGVLPGARARLLQRLAALGIAVEVVPYPAHASVEEGKALRGEMVGTFTKNLLVKDRKDRLFLLSIHEDRIVDLKTSAALIGGKGHLSFARAERMHELLGVAPGALTPLGLLSDREGQITAVIDAALMGCAQLNFHPLVHTESIGLAPAALVRFVRSCGREPLIVDFDACADAVRRP